MDIKWNITKSNWINSESNWFLGDGIEFVNLHQYQTVYCVCILHIMNPDILTENANCLFFISKKIKYWIKQAQIFDSQSACFLVLKAVLKQKVWWPSIHFPEACIPALSHIQKHHALDEPGQLDEYARKTSVCQAVK